MTDLETKNTKDNPVPEDAVWKEDPDRQFYEASLENGDVIEYHIRDGFYYLGSFVEDQEDIEDEELSNGS